MLRQEFAVVLLDVRMPGMDGFETAANIKRLDQTKDVPIILVTGTEGGADYAYRGYAIGAADFIAKPVDPWVLRTKVTVFLDLHRKNRQLAMRATGTDTDRLTEISQQLTEIKLLLRDSRSRHGSTRRPHRRGGAHRRKPPPGPHRHRVDAFSCR
jgi:CheY-like chemotaxis protein